MKSRSLNIPFLSVLALSIASCGSSDIAEYTNEYQIKACGDLSASLDNSENSLEGNYQLAHSMAVRTVEHDCVNELDRILQTGFDINYVQGSQTIMDVAKFNKNNPELIIGYLTSIGASSPYFDKHTAENKAREDKAKAREEKMKASWEEKKSKQDEREAKNAEARAKIKQKNAERDEERRIRKLPVCEQLSENLKKEAYTPTEAFNKAVVDNCPDALPAIVGLLAAEGLTALPEVTYKNWTGDAIRLSVRSKRPELVQALINSELFDKKVALAVLNPYIKSVKGFTINDAKIEALAEYIKLGYLEFDPDYTQSFVERAYLGGNKAIIKLVADANYNAPPRGAEFGLKNFRLGADLALYKDTRGLSCPDTIVEGHSICTMGYSNSNSQSIFGVTFERIDLTFIDNRLALIQAYIEHSSRSATEAADDKNFQEIVKGLTTTYGEDKDNTANIAYWNNDLSQRIKIVHNVRVGTVQASGMARAYNIIKDRQWRVNVFKIEDRSLMTKLRGINKQIKEAAAKAEAEKAVAELAEYVAKSGEKGNLAKFNGLEIGKPLPEAFADMLNCNGNEENEKDTDYKGNEPRAKQCYTVITRGINDGLGPLRVESVKVLLLDGILTQVAFKFNNTNYAEEGLEVLQILHGNGVPLAEDNYEKDYWRFVPREKGDFVQPTYWSKDGVEAVFGQVHSMSRFLKRNSYRDRNLRGWMSINSFIIADTAQFRVALRVFNVQIAAAEKKVRDAKKAKADAEKARKAADF